jgi:hypothetical protein
MAFDAHLAAAHGVATYDAGSGSDLAAAGEAEILAQMRLFGRARGKQFHAFRDFHEAFFALTLFAAGGRHLDSEGVGAVEKREAGREILLVGVEV